MIAGLILAGGASRRMGSPKALLPFSKQPLVVAHWAAMRSALVDPVRIVVGAHAAQITRGAGLSRETFVRNAQHALGQLSSIQAGMKALLEDPTWPAVLVQPVDALPARPEVIARLTKRFARGGVEAVKPAFEGKGGHPVLLSRKLAKRILRLDPRTDRLDLLLRALESRGAAVRLSMPWPEVLANLNDPAVYRSALRRVRPLPG